MLVFGCRCVRGMCALGGRRGGRGGEPFRERCLFGELCALVRAGRAERG
jgi:hypothetical protein